MATDLRPVPVNPAFLPTPRGYSHGTSSENTLCSGGQAALDLGWVGRDRRDRPGPVDGDAAQHYLSVI